MEIMLSNIVSPIIVGATLMLLSYWLDKRKTKDDK
ncbi:MULTISPECIES: type I toxin-antitoxin system Fst family toxin [Mammaliicoccus]|nr:MULTISPECIES: type I toxin-antitoxin system Fst family toxin [Mammaliicoccus]MBO3061412.1 type I toxin-antitoxin system Fst family toxin [Mammaliicoccus fleurettii]MEB7805885.1 type I toxin-antitoxin system Fst family toxin [Mammaliicoccus fleurettii]